MQQWSSAAFHGTAAIWGEAISKASNRFYTKRRRGFPEWPEQGRVLTCAPLVWGGTQRSWDLLSRSLVPACKASLCPSVGWDPWLRPDGICRIIYSLICFPCWRAVKLDSIEHGMRFDTVIPLHLWVITNTPLARLLLLHSFQPVVSTLRLQVSICPQGLQKCIDDHRCIFWN